MAAPMLHRYVSPLGELLEQAEDERGISARKAAEMCGVSAPAYTAWKGSVRPSIDYVPALSALCTVPASVILEALGVEVDRTYEFEAIP